MKDFSFAEREAVHILSSWAFTEGVKAETGITCDMACAGWWEVFCSVSDAIDKHLDGREPRSDEEADAASRAGRAALSPAYKDEAEASITMERPDERWSRPFPAPKIMTKDPEAQTDHKSKEEE